MLLGILIGTAGTITGTLGKQLLRYAEIQKQQGNTSGLIMVAAFGMQVVLAPVLEVISFAFAPQTTLAPLNGLGLVWNTLLAPFTLNESLSASRIGACVIISAAMVAIALSGSDVPEEKVVWTVEHVQQMLFCDTFAVYALCVVSWVASHVYFQSGRPTNDRMRGLSLGMLGGSLAGNMFFVKITVELVGATADSGLWLETFTQPLPWLCVVGLVGFATSNVGFLAQGLKEQEALFMVSVFTGAQVVAGFVSGVVVLGEPAPLTHVCALGLVVVGICMLVLGERTPIPSPMKIQGEGWVGEPGDTGSPHGTGRQMRLRPRAPKVV